MEMPSPSRTGKPFRLSPTATPGDRPTAGHCRRSARVEAPVERRRRRRTVVARPFLVIPVRHGEAIRGEPILTPFLLAPRLAVPADHLAQPDAGAAVAITAGLLEPIGLIVPVAPVPSPIPPPIPVPVGGSRQGGHQKQ